MSTTTEEEVKKKVTLKSSDGDDFVVDEAVAVESLSSFSALCSINPTTEEEEEEEEAKEKKIITLKSSDDVTFEVDEAVALESQTIKHMIEDGCADNGIPLPNVDSEILAMVIEYCEKHVEAAAAAAVPKGGSGGDDDRTKENELRKWDADFVKVDQDTIFELILAANYLEIKSLSDLTCQTMADFIKDKTPEEVREIFNIKNDFTPEEEEAVRRENQWAFD